VAAHPARLPSNEKGAHTGYATGWSPLQIQMPPYTIQYPATRAKITINQTQPGDFAWAGGSCDNGGLEAMAACRRGPGPPGRFGSSLGRLGENHGKSVIPGDCGGVHLLQGNPERAKTADSPAVGVRTLQTGIHRLQGLMACPPEPPGREN